MKQLTLKTAGLLWLVAFVLPGCGTKTVEVAFISQVNEDFERTDAAANWVFGNGPEFPGAMGNFAVVAGRGRTNSKGGLLAFNFTGGGNYVIATQAFSGPVQLKGISFWISGFVPGTRLLVRLTDESDQTFQYFPTVSVGAAVRAGAAAGTSAGWVQIHVHLGDWDSSWEGASDGVFHGGLKAWGIGVEKGVQYYKTGEMAIDDISEMTSAEIAFDPFGRDRLPEFYTGSVSELIGVNIHFIRPETKLLDLAKRAGFGFVRMDLFWPMVEKSASQYDFSEYDLLMRALEERGMGALFILDYGNPLYYDGPGGFNDKWGPQTAATRAAYARFALAAAKHYSGRKVMLEVWNEPNVPHFWLPAPHPANYGLLANEAYKAVKEEIADVPIIVGAASGCDAAFLGQVFDVPGLANVDAVSIHPYRDRAPETFVQERILVQDVLRRKTGRSDVPLYSGEWGYPSTMFGGRNEAAWKKQAAYAIRLILINILSRVPKTVWYDLKDDGSNPSELEHNFGLLTENSAAKPAFNAVKTLTDLLPGRERGDTSINSWTISAVETRANDVYGLVFQNERGRLAALWTSHARGSVEVKIPDSNSYRFFNLFGDSVTPVKRENGFCFLSLNGENGPVYVKY
ncbi:MAG: cellulase family glycosylhydrolase [Candidatus Aminicenantes bacterium]|nr:cellulase family glycosylhydrolase [Candidatus Aminicenantes bacterium]